MDKTDKKILNALLEDSRQSFREIAKKTRVSVVTVLKRVKSMEKQGVIKRHSTELDYEALGYDFPVTIRLKISKGKLFEVEKKIAANPNVYAIYDVTGEFDALLLARFASRRSLDSFLKKIQAFDFVTKTETSLILNTIKQKNIRLPDY